MLTLWAASRWLKAVSLLPNAAHRPAELEGNALGEPERVQIGHHHS
jgi:hypothetical protein